MSSLGSKQFSLIAPFFALCVVVGALLLSISAAQARSDVEFVTKNGRTDLVIRAKNVDILEPHIHEDLDSIIDKVHGEIVGLQEGPYTLDRDIWITGFKWEVENAPIETLHHFIFTREDRPAILCPNGFSDKEELLVVGSDTFVHEFSFPPQYAVFLPKGAPLDMEAVLHNPLPPFGPGGTYENVRVKLTLHLGEKNKEYKPVRLVRLSVEDPACTPRSSTFDVPANARSFVKKIDSPISSYTFERPATILLMGAHTHSWDGGEEISVYLNDIWLFDFVPRRKNEDPWSWATPSRLPNLKVQTGDTISLSSTYSNPHDLPLLNEAMGMLMVAFSEE